MKSNIEWNMWGKVDPLFGVAAWKDKSKNGPGPWQDDEFYALGKSDWMDFKRHWEQYGFKNGTCLEIGCGAGRITKHLAADFDLVKAVDVSEGMIEYAKMRILDANVEFILSGGIEIPVRDNSVDAVFSTHVFQHFDHLEDAFRYFKEIYRVMSNEGTLLIHLPIYRWPGYGRIYTPIHRFIKRIGDLKAQRLRNKIKRGGKYPLMRGLPYEVDWLYKTLDDLGFSEVEFRIIRLKSNNDSHPFVMAKKRR